MWRLCKCYMSRFDNWNFKIMFDVIWNYLFSLKTGALTGCLTCIRYRNRTQPRFDKKLPCEPPLGRGAEKEALPESLQAFEFVAARTSEKVYLIFSRWTVFWGAEVSVLKTNGRNWVLSFLLCERECYYRTIYYSIHAGSFSSTQ